MKKVRMRLLRKWKRIQKLFSYRIITKETEVTPSSRRLELLIIRRCTPNGEPDNDVYLFGNVIPAFFKLYTKDATGWQPTALGLHYNAQRVSIPFYIPLLNPHSLHTICRDFGIHHIRIIYIR
jgi:hypothetical protein